MHKLERNQIEISSEAYQRVKVFKEVIEVKYKEVENYQQFVSGIGEVVSQLDSKVGGLVPYTNYISNNLPWLSSREG